MKKNNKHLQWFKVKRVLKIFELTRVECSCPDTKQQVCGPWAGWRYGGTKSALNNITNDLALNWVNSRGRLEGKNRRQNGKWAWKKSVWTNISSSTIDCQKTGVTSSTLARLPLFSRAGINCTLPLLFAQTYVVSFPPCVILQKDKQKKFTQELQ